MAGMLTLETAHEIIEQALEELTLPEEPKNLYEPVRYILRNGGKRIRPALVLLGCDLFGGDYRKAVYPALGIEIFHNFTLLHDDLMDHSPVRRNRPTVHVKWDENTAILSGDVMSILSNQYICRTDSDKVSALSTLFTTTALEVCEGQMLDMEYARLNEVTIPQYINMIRLKTSVLIAASLAMGALVAGAGEEDTRSIYRFGMHLGISFQLQDDMLDTFGDEKIFGKKIGNDILTNKRTFLFLKALEKASYEERKVLQEYYSGGPWDPEEKIRNVKILFNKLGIKEETEKMIGEHYSTALDQLESLGTLPENRKVLMKFSETLMSREK